MAGEHVPTWQDRLDPFGHLFVNLDDHMDSMLRALPDSELAAVQDAASRVSKTNCWSYVYDAGPFVQRAVVKEQGRRKTLFMDDADGGDSGAGPGRAGEQADGALAKGLRKAVADPGTEWLDANVVRLLLDRHDSAAGGEQT